MLKDRYVTDGALGFGGFGITYISWDTAHGKRMAISEGDNIINSWITPFSTLLPGDEPNPHTVQILKKLATAKIG